jgi:hypothetical protein
MLLPSHVVLLAELLAQRRLRDVRIRPSRCGCAGTLTDMMMRRTLEGAPKCAFLDLRRELARAVLTLVMLAAVWCVGVSRVSRRQLGIVKIAQLELAYRVWAEVWRQDAAHRSYALMEKS